jgi:hypothetical protein
MNDVDRTPKNIKKKKKQGFSTTHISNDDEFTSRRKNYANDNKLDVSSSLNSSIKSGVS